MANIPVEKKGGAPWLWIIIGLIVAAVLLWMLFAGGTDDDYAEVEPVEDTDVEVVMAEPVDPEVAAESLDVAEYEEIDTAAPLNDLSRITMDSAEARAPVNLTNVEVGNVVGDRTFRVMDDEGNELFVVLDQVPTPNTSTEGRYDINPGQRIDVSGTLRVVDDGAIDGEMIEDMDDDVEYYLWADEATIEERS